jgi:hypothetical protein
MGFMIATIGGYTAALKLFILFTYSNDTGLAFVTVVIRGRPAFRTEELVIFIEDLERKLTCARHHIAYYKMISYLALP